MSSELEQLDQVADRVAARLGQVAAALGRPAVMTQLLAVLHLVAVGSVADYLAAHDVSAIVPAIAIAVAGAAQVLAMILDAVVKTAAAKHLTAATKVAVATVPAIGAAVRAETAKVDAAEAAARPTPGRKR